MVLEIINNNNKIYVDFALGISIYKVDVRDQDITEMQKYLPEAGYKYNKNYKPGIGVYPYTNVIFYLKFGNLVNKWKKISKSKSFLANTCGSVLTADATMVVSMLQKSLIQPEKNSVYLNSIWRNKECKNSLDLINLMFDALLALADKYESKHITNILSVRLEHANLIDLYTYKDNIGLYNSEVIMPRHMSFKEIL